MLPSDGPPRTVSRRDRRTWPRRSRGSVGSDGAPSARGGRSYGAKHRPAHEVRRFLPSEARPKRASMPTVAAAASARRGRPRRRAAPRRSTTSRSTAGSSVGRASAGVTSTDTASVLAVVPLNMPRVGGHVGVVAADRHAHVARRRPRCRGSGRGRPSRARAACASTHACVAMVAGRRPVVGDARARCSR